jgi:hypothetical protein
MVMTLSPKYLERFKVQMQELDEARTAHQAAPGDLQATLRYIHAEHAMVTLEEGTWQPCLTMNCSGGFHFDPDCLDVGDLFPCGPRDVLNPSPTTCGHAVHRWAGDHFQLIP